MGRSASDVVRGLVVGVASLPSVYLRLVEVIKHPRSSATDMANVIGEDPGLTVRLLRLVNSAFYGFPSKIETVSRAVTVVGTQQLTDLALATSVISMFDKVPEALVTMDSFWRHSLGCGVFARALATQRREANVERLFVAGLLHDIGSILIYTGSPEQAGDVLAHCRDTGELRHVAERRILGFDHADVGGKLLSAWDLSQSHQEAVAHHHKPTKAPGFPKEASVVHVADIIANGLRMGSSGEHLVPPLDPAVWDSLGVDPGILPNVMDETQRQFDDAVRVMLPEGSP